MRRVATDPRLLELAKVQTPDMAKCLAEELQRVLGSTVRVSQPIKHASLASEANESTPAP